MCFRRLLDAVSVWEPIGCQRQYSTSERRLRWNSRAIKRALRHAKSGNARPTHPTRRADRTVIRRSVESAMDARDHGRSPSLPERPRLPWRHADDRMDVQGPRTVAVLLVVSRTGIDGVSVKPRMAHRAIHRTA